jgi:hypothetical protein
MTFEEPLQIELTVTIAGRPYEISADEVKYVELDLRQAGFSGVVEFVRADDARYGGPHEDKLAAAFWDSGELSVELSLRPARPTPEAESSVEPLSVRGRGARRALWEEPAQRTQRPVLWRKYRVEFGDPARLAWSQHFPCELYADKSLLDVALAQATSDVKLASSWSAVTEARRQWFLHLPEHAGASFYDFLVWYLDSRGGGLVYDYAQGSYELVAAPNADKPAKALFGDDVATIGFRWGEPGRARPRVRCSYVGAPDTTVIELEHAIAPLVRDHLIRTPIAEEQSARVEAEKLRSVLPPPETELTFARYPSVQVVPGARLKCPASARFPEASKLATSEWLARRVQLRAHASTASLGALENSSVVAMTVELSAALGHVTDRSLEGFRFVPPRFPGYVEGVVVSQQGEDPEETWDSPQNATSAQLEVEVKVPLFDKSVFCPFEPVSSPASVFSPHIRGERVLLALDLEESRIVRSLSWRPRVALPKPGQGEGLVFGKSEKNNTKLSHVYQDGVPVLDLARIHEKDRVTVTLSEGKLVIGVMEEAG